ncbi:hypothetical protein NHQ30_007948 [Ciborinia camelliae]|nr:hypothetical protein NHQ30_007948 [Ciborinia camelliae]
MFRNRTSSQKPCDEFIANFRQKFPEVTTATTSSSGENRNTHFAAPANGPPRQVSLLQWKLHHSLGGEEINDLDPTPRAQHDPWRFTPTLLDQNHSLSMLANQTPSYYTPTPAGMNSLYHHQAGDLHTHSMGMSMGLGTHNQVGDPNTPRMGMNMGLGSHFSLPTSEGALLTDTMMEISDFDQPQSPIFQNFDPFSGFHNQQQAQEPQPTSFAPSSFVRHDTGYETMEHDGSPMDDTEGPLGSMEQAMHQSPLTISQPQSHDMAMSGSVPPSAEKFRFQVVLNAPTAMIKHADEIPVTYLNKGQAYSVSVTDTGLTQQPQPGTRYRTFVRISFEDEQQRQRPASCWQLWKEGRGTNEAHQRGGKLQAVEYVPTPQPGEIDDNQTHVELDTASFDGFSVIWTPGFNRAPECHLAVRFNFLSTDFSHSKGVKGIPVRFCAKTETLTSGSPHVNETSEVAFCKVKLFRDHGAERKLSNDIAHVKKTIEKLKQQMDDAETGIKNFGKRKRGSIAKAQMSEQRPGKVQKHKRTWSMSSTSSAGARAPMEEDLNEKLQTMNSMFASPRLVSLLYLRGSEQDDPDLHPVALVGEPLDLTKVDPSDSAIWAKRSVRSSLTGSSSIISPSPSLTSLHSQAAAPPSNPSASWSELHNPPSGDFQNQNPQHLASPPDQLTKVRQSDDPGSLGRWIEALGVDSSYNPPIIEQPVKPVACFYVRRRDPSQPNKQEYYRAIYLMQRTLKDFIEAIALRWDIDATNVIHAIHVHSTGVQSLMTDDDIRTLAEAQDFVFELHSSQAPAKSESKMHITVDRDGDDNDNHGDHDMTQNVFQGPGYELKIFF